MFYIALLAIKVHRTHFNLGYVYTQEGQRPILFKNCKTYKHLQNKTEAIVHFTAASCTSLNKKPNKSC